MPVWVWHNGTRMLRQGYCSDISDGGVYVLMSNGTDLPLGDDVEVVIGTQSDDHVGYGLHKNVACAEVVRLEKLGYGTGVALRFCDCFRRVDLVQHLLLS